MAAKNCMNFHKIVVVFDKQANKFLLHLVLALSFSQKLTVMMIVSLLLSAIYWQFLAITENALIK